MNQREGEIVHVLDKRHRRHTPPADDFPHQAPCSVERMLPCGDVVAALRAYQVGSPQKSLNVVSFRNRFPGGGRSEREGGAAKFYTRCDGVNLTEFSEQYLNH